MSSQTKADGRPCSPQRGFALLLLLLVMATGGLYLLVSNSNQNNLERTRADSTAKVLAQAKEALIAWSVMQGDVGSGTYKRPGILPCPDTNDSGLQASACAANTYTTIGRLPWKTLGLDDLRDADSERLWYVMSNKFRRYNLNRAAINSDTLGDLQLYAADGSSLLTPAGEELVALIIAPGIPLAAQSRSSASASCSTTGSSINENRCAANYLESANGRNNGTASGPFIAGPVLDANQATTLNDRVIGVSARELIAAVEKRALKEAQLALAGYLSANGKLPNPARQDSPNCLATISQIDSSPPTCDSDSTVCFGRLPELDLNPYAASWLRQNGWGRTWVYAVNRNAVIDGSAAECSTVLSLDGQTKDYVLVAPGTPRNGQTRPSSSLAAYLEDPANQDAWSSGAANQAGFVTPGGTGNDQIRATP